MVFNRVATGIPVVHQRCGVRRLALHLDCSAKMDHHTKDFVWHEVREIQLNLAADECRQ